MAGDNSFGHLLPGARPAPTPTQATPDTPPAFIRGTPNPYRQNAETRANNAEVRATVDQNMQVQKFNQDIADKQRGTAPAGYRFKPDNTLEKIPGAPDPENKPTEFQAKSAGFYGRLLEAEGQFGKVPDGSRDARTVIGQVFHEQFPNLENTFNSADRQMADQAARNFIAASLRLESGAAISEEEYKNQYRIFFPMPGDGPEAIRQKAEARRQAIEGFRIAAGPLAQQVDSSRQANDRAQPAKDPTNQDIYGAAGTDIKYGGGGDGGPFDRGRYLQDTYGIGAGDEAKIVSFWNTNAGNPGLTTEAVKQWYTANGYTKAMPTDEQIVGMIQQSAKGQGFSGFDLSGAEKAYQEKLQGINASREAPGAGDLLQQGLMANLGDEASGVGGAIGAAVTGNNPVDAYYTYRDAERLRLDQARQNAGGWGTAAEFLGAAATGGVQAPNALARLLPNQLAKEGAMLGAVQGFGSGEGVGGSVGNALAGAGIGAAVGKFSDTANAMLASRAANRSAPSLNAAEVATAGRAEGITVNRAMIDPRSNNRVTTADASLIGGPRIQAGMQEIEGQIARRVDDIGGGGTALDKIAEGDMYRGAAERAIKETGDIAKRRYDKAAQLAGDTTVPPRESLTVIDEMLAKLGETPNRNANEISFLQGLKDDLSKNLSVGALRDIRTDLRKRISSGSLVFGQNEARVLDIMDAASADIRNGLIAAGKPQAAKAFDVADKAYRARMEYINGTLQKVIGKRGATLSSEQIAQKVASMSKTDAKGFRRFYASLSPDEALDASTTVAERLGHNGNDGFSVAHFLTETSPQKMSETTLVTLFGQSGAQSIKNLRTLGEQVQRVTRAMNSRTSKSGVAGDMRSWVASLLFGGGIGGLGGSTSAIATAVGVGAAKAGVDLLSARALMSPKITKWIAQTPATNSPKAINAHLERLSRIAANDNTIAAEAIGLRQVVEEAIRGSGRAAAGQSIPLPSSQTNEETAKTPQ